ARLSCWRRAGSFFFQAEDGIRDWSVTGVQTCALPISVRDCRLPSRRGMGAVVEADVEEVRRRRGGDRGERTRVHEHVAVAVEDEIGRASCRERGESAGGGGALRNGA